MTDKLWRFSESRPIHPFRVSETALDGIEFRIRDDLNFTADHPWHVIVEPEDISAPTFRPQFKLGINTSRLTEDTLIAADDLSVTVIGRDPALWRATRLVAWNLTEVPETYLVSDQILQHFSGARGLQFEVQISPARQLTPSFRKASYPGQILSRRAFDITLPGDGSDFPVDLVEPSIFEERGLPRETVWAIDWRLEDFDQPAEDVLVVLINKEQGQKLLRLSSSDSVGAVVWRQMGVEIFVEICVTILGSAPAAPQNPESLLSKIYLRLHRDTGLDLDSLTQRARTLTGMSYLRSYL
ncbi:MAG TPA: hypothetical protein VM842_04565, partial [Nitrospira sp.]|nr:hypothetical protein [Nitrospira sp.]